MPRPTTKAALLALAEENLTKLLALIDELPAPDRTRSYLHRELNDRDQTIADVVCHLHEWHRMTMGWYEVGMSGRKPAIPAEDVTWRTLPVLNRRIHQKYQGTELGDALAMLRESHRAVLAIVRKHTDAELFTKKRYAWTGTTSLGAYLVSATSSHYDWAMKTIRPIRKLVKERGARAAR